jgi:uncharacterized phage protein (TIGR02220 family)
MSIQAMAWAMQQQIVLEPAQRHVLLCVANYADHQGKAAFPSAARLMKDTGLSERTVRRKLLELEQTGVISKGNQSVVAAYIERADKRPIAYDLNLSRGVTDAPRDVTGCHPVTNGVSLTTERGVTVTPNPSCKPSIEPSLSGEPDSASKTADEVVDVLAYLNEKTGRRFKPVRANTDLIRQRLREGATVDECKAVVDAKSAEWGADPKMQTYLRPETLFGAKKFAQYVGQLGGHVTAANGLYEGAI